MPKREKLNVAPRRQSGFFAPRSTRLRSPGWTRPRTGGRSPWPRPRARMYCKISARSRTGHIVEGKTFQTVRNELDLPLTCPHI